MKKLFFLLLFLMVAGSKCFGMDVGAHQSGGLDIGAYQGDVPATTTTAKIIIGE